MTDERTPEEWRALKDERKQALAQLEGRLETPMLVLGFAWLG